LIAHPKDKVILDGSASKDADKGDKVTFRWSQSSGPKLDSISDAQSEFPAVTIPDLEKDAKITMKLVVSDGKGESKANSVTIYVDAIDKTKGSEEKEIKPAEIVKSNWEPNGRECRGDRAADCLGDNSDKTFLSSGKIDSTSLLSFNLKDLESQGLEIEKINYIALEATARKTGDEPAYLSFMIGDGDKEKELEQEISISSDSFAKYVYAWKENPVTGDRWKADDSINSLVAGIKHSAEKDSGIDVSEINLLVSFTAAKASEGKDGETTSTAKEEQATQGDSSGSEKEQQSDGDNEETTKAAEQSQSPDETDIGELDLQQQELEQQATNDTRSNDTSDAQQQEN
jgi:hypothetical protein